MRGGRLRQPGVRLCLHLGKVRSRRRQLRRVACVRLRPGRLGVGQALLDCRATADFLGEPLFEFGVA